MFYLIVGLLAIMLALNVRRGYSIFDLPNQFLILCVLTQLVPFWVLGQNVFIIEIYIFSFLVIAFFLDFRVYTRLNYESCILVPKLSVLLFLVLIVISFFTSIYLSILVFGFVVAHYSNHSKKFVFFAILLFFMVGVAYAFSNGDRRLLLVFAITALYVMDKFLFYDKRFFFYSSLLCLIPSLVFLLMLIGFNRVGISISDAVDRIGSLGYMPLLNLIDLGMYPLPLDNIYFDSRFREDFSSFYLTGFSFERIFYLVIPREIFEKPLNSSAVLAQMLHFSPNSEGASLAAGMPAEAFLNFQWGGIFFLVIIYYLLKKFVNFKSLLGYLMVFSLTGFFQSIFRGSSETLFVIWLVNTVFSCCFFVILQNFIKKRVVFCQ